MQVCLEDSFGGPCRGRTYGPLIKRTNRAFSQGFDPSTVSPFFGFSASYEGSIDSIKSIESMILTPSITIYHSEGPPIFNVNRRSAGLFGC